MKITPICRVNFLKLKLIQKSVFPRIVIYKKKNAQRIR